MIALNEQRLTAYFNQVHNQPLTLGRLDCVRFAIEALYHGWGIDYRAILGYADRRTAVDRLRIAGGLEAAFTAELGEPVPPPKLEPGDIAYFNDPAIGLVMPGYVAVKFRGTIVRTPPQFVSKGWHSWRRL